MYNFENPEPFAPPRFDANDPYIADFFKENGYVVIKQVANAEQRETAINLFWDLCESKQPALNRNEPATWKTEHWIASPSVGIMSGYGIGQSEFLWYARLLPKVKEAFAKIWQSDDLLVSYDGCGVFRPPEQNPKWATEGAWYHIDQNCYNRVGLHAIQGIVNFYPSGPYDGGFVVVPKSHKMMDDAFAKKEIPDLCSKKSRDYFRTPEDLTFWVEARNAITRDETNRYELLPVKLVIDAGDMVLWDSRTIHCSHPATKLDKNCNNRLKRLAAYVMTPASSAKNLEELAKYRVLAFQKGITTTHWPHEFYPSWLSREKLPGVGADVVKLTEEQKTLITGKAFSEWDVYDEKLVEDVSLDNLNR